MGSLYPGELIRMDLLPEVDLLIDMLKSTDPNSNRLEGKTGHEMR